MMEAFSNEGLEIVVKRYQFKPVLNANAIQTRESSSDRIRGEIGKVSY